MRIVMVYSSSKDASRCFLGCTDWIYAHWRNYRSRLMERSNYVCDTPASWAKCATAWAGGSLLHFAESGSIALFDCEWPVIKPLVLSCIGVSIDLSRSHIISHILLHQIFLQHDCIICLYCLVLTSVFITISECVSWRRMAVKWCEVLSDGEC